MDTFGETFSGAISYFHEDKAINLISYAIMTNMRSEVKLIFSPNHNKFTLAFWVVNVKLHSN